MEQVSYPPPPLVGTKMTQTPVGARVNQYSGPVNTRKKKGTKKHWSPVPRFSIRCVALAAEMHVTPPFAPQFTFRSAATRLTRRLDMTSPPPDRYVIRYVTPRAESAVREEGGAQGPTSLSAETASVTMRSDWAATDPGWFSRHQHRQGGDDINTGGWIL